jgi:hypothetical protein
MASKFAVKSLDHIVLTVKSIPESITFYTQTLGMRHEAFRSPKDESVERLVFSQFLMPELFQNFISIPFEFLRAEKPKIFSALYSEFLTKNLAHNHSQSLPHLRPTKDKSSPSRQRV